MEKAGIVLAVAFLAVCIVCACVESKVTAPYKWFKVYGRFKAYLAMDLTMVGIVGIVAGIVSPNSVVMFGVESRAVTVLGSTALLVPGLLLYALTVIKCPPFLRGKCIISMIITGFGVTMKICVFFLVFIWKIAAPQTVTMTDGMEYLVYAGDVYTHDGVCVGRRNEYGGYTIAKDEHGNPVAI